jgi:hypothetical protein
MKTAEELKIELRELLKHTQPGEFTRPMDEIIKQLFARNCFDEFRCLPYEEKTL